MNNMKNKKNKSAVILNPERSEWVSRSHVTGVEPVVNDGAKTKGYSAKRDLYARSPKGSRLKMTEKALSFLRLRGASGAQGISAPASCREAHKRRVLFNSWILRFVKTQLVMTIPMLALLFSFNLSLCFAADSAPTSGFCNTAETCLWSLDESGKLSITAKTNPETGKPYENVVMDNYKLESMEVSPNNWEDWSTAPWAGSYQNGLRIKEVYVGDGITNIGDEAFEFTENLTSVSGMNDVKSIGNGAFGFTNLTNITLPDSVTSIGASAFYNAGLSSIDLPDSVTDVGDAAFWDIPQVIISDTLAETIGNWSYNPLDSENPITILCKGDVEKCKSTLRERTWDDETVSCPAKDKNLSANCVVWPDYTISEVSESQCTGNYGWNGASCARKDENGNVSCASGYAGYQGKCWSELPFSKKRWTPAEANQWLHDGNDNFVVITFKK